MIVRGERLPLADRRVDAIVTGPSVVELCAGAGGMALGFEQAGFRHAALYEIDSDAVTTLRLNRPAWDVRQHDVSEVDVACPPCDVLAAGVPCPPFSQAGRKLGPDDERDLFPALLSWVRAVSPKAVVVENVSGLLSQRFDAYRRHILATLEAMGYEGEWRLLDASLLGVPQRRRRSVLVAMRSGGWSAFRWPVVSDQPLALGPVLAPRLAARGLPDPEAWAVRADSPAPTICGGSKKHGGADLGPSSARRTWGALGVYGSSVADDAERIVSVPFRLTVADGACIQGFPADWTFTGRKTARWRQVGNAFPPSVAAAVAGSVRAAISAADGGDGD